jgi:hypothetical protein
MTQIGIAALDRVGLAFIRHRGIGRLSIDQVAIGREAITIVRLGLWGLIDHRLQRGLVPFLDHCPANDAVGASVEGGYDVDPVFFCPTKVYNSSSSTVSLVAGVGIVSGVRSAAALTQLITV